MSGKFGRIYKNLRRSLRFKGIELSKLFLLRSFRGERRNSRRPAVPVTHLRNFHLHKPERLVCKSKFERTIHPGPGTVGGTGFKRDYAKAI